MATLQKPKEEEETPVLEELERLPVATGDLKIQEEEVVILKGNDTDVETVSSATTTTQKHELYSGVDVFPEIEEGFTMDDQTIKAINSLFKLFDEEALKMDEFGREKYESITATFYDPTNNCTLHLTRGKEKEHIKYGSWNRAYTAYQISDNHNGYGSFKYKSLHGLSSFQSTNCEHVCYDKSAGGWPVYDDGLIGGFSICAKNSTYDSKMAKILIMSSGYETSPMGSMNDQEFEDECGGYNICNDHWLVKISESNWAIRRHHEGIQKKLKDCEHKWVDVRNFYGDKVEFPNGICPLCEKAKMPVFKIRKKPRQHKKVFVTLQNENKTEK